MPVLGKFMGFSGSTNYITICFKSKSDDFFEIRKRTIIDRILIKLSLLINGSRQLNEVLF